MHGEHCCWPIAITMFTALADLCPLCSGWTEVMATNVEGSYNAARACYPHMKEAGHGKVGSPEQLARREQGSAIARGFPATICLASITVRRPTVAAVNSLHMCCLLVPSSTDCRLCRWFLCRPSRVPAAQAPRWRMPAAKALCCRWRDPWLPPGAKTSEGPGWAKNAGWPSMGARCIGAAPGAHMDGGCQAPGPQLTLGPSATAAFKSTRWYLAP